SQFLVQDDGAPRPGASPAVPGRERQAEQAQSPQLSEGLTGDPQLRLPAGRARDDVIPHEPSQDVTQRPVLLLKERVVEQKRVDDAVASGHWAAGSAARAARTWSSR